MGRKKLNEDEIRKAISVRLTQKEKNIIIEKAAAHGIKSSTYLRNLGLNYPISSIVDQKTANDLLRTSASIGRLGGLFKYWLADNRFDKQDFSNKRTYKNIDDLVDDILSLQNLLKEQALNIMKSK